MARSDAAVLLFSFYATDISGMQLSEIIHAIVAMLFIVAMLGHIYLGSIGEEGAFEAMGSGTVDVNWAKQHRALWHEDMQQVKDQRRPVRTQPAE